MTNILFLALLFPALAFAQVKLTPDAIEERFRALEQRILELEAELAAVKGEKGLSLQQAGG